MAEQLKKNIFSIRANDWDRKLFDELIPLPDGTSYNSYLIKGSKKTALIDSADPLFSDFVLGELKALDVRKIDYIIANHAEQDHSGSIPRILDIYPEAVVVTNEKCRNMLLDLLDIYEDRFRIIKDGEELSLGDKTLKFVMTPWVHWPETLVTFLVEDRILFSCDFFGSHYASSELYVKDERVILEAAKRYYAEIMMPFRKKIIENLKKIDDLKYHIIAPSHGPVYDKPGFIVDAYRDWVSDEVKNQVVIAYVSMHGSTLAMVDHIASELEHKNIPVQRFNLAEVDIGLLANSLVDAATLVVAAPTVIVDPHPLAQYAAVLVNTLNPKTRFIGVMGSYGWAGTMVGKLGSLISRVKAEVLPPVLVQGHPKKDDMIKISELAEEIYRKHKSIKII
ncbi:MAG: FprA family A-type flavoprotein [Nanoarchaeota archaeon]|nr:FprA family A-type flavoprotein [Nanoarchaeota archaeon]